MTWQIHLSCHSQKCAFFSISLICYRISISDFDVFLSALGKCFKTHKMFDVHWKTCFEINNRAHSMTKNTFPFGDSFFPSLIAEPNIIHIRIYGLRWVSIYILCFALANNSIFIFDIPSQKYLKSDFTVLRTYVWLLVHVLNFFGKYWSICNKNTTERKCIRFNHQKSKYFFESENFSVAKIGNVPSTLTWDHQKIECQWEKSAISACLLCGFFCLSCGFRKESFFSVRFHCIVCPRFLVSYWKRQRPPHRATQTKKKCIERIKSVKWKSFIFRLLLMVSREKLYIEYVPNVEMYDFPMLFDGWYELCDDRLFYESRLFSNWMPKWNWIR